VCYPRVPEIIGRGSRSAVILAWTPELKNMLLYIFVWKAKASAEAAGEKKDRHGKSRGRER